MTKILKKVFSLDADVSSETDAYMDDIVVNCDMVSPCQVIDHLAQYGLITLTTGNDRKRKSTWTSNHKEQDGSAIVVTW